MTIADLPPAPDEPTAADKVRADKVDLALNALAEHFDAVHIFGSYKNEDKTSMYNRGRGSYYARYGMVKQWIIREELEP